MQPGRIVLYIATSVDGYIADEEGGVDWLEAYEQADTDEAVDGFSEFFESVDCLVMGAATYEQILTFGAWPYDDKPTYVVTHRDLPPVIDSVEFVDRRIAALVSDLRGRYDRIWLVGGGTLAQAFLAENAVDELRLFVVPELLGGGIALFGGASDRQRLRLLDVAVHDTGIVEHHYEVLGAEPSRLG